MIKQLLYKLAAVVLGLLGLCVAVTSAAFMLISSIASLSVGGFIALFVFIGIVVVELFNKKE